jgi:hypothetical protein
MPVTAKLSRKFYETFGDEIANELVDWFNQVDSTYRSELKELNELNFARFDAKVEQRFAESAAKLDQRFADVEVKLERRFAEAKVDVEQRLAAFESQVIRQFGKVDAQFAELRGYLNSRLLAHTRWMVGVWATVALAILGLYFR